MPVITCIEDLKRLHRKRTPRMFWTIGGFGRTCRASLILPDFASLRLRQRVARGLSGGVLEGHHFVGNKVSMPVGLSPVGSTGMQHPDGEILAARAAAKAGVPFTFPTMSICSIRTWWSC